MESAISSIEAAKEALFKYSFLDRKDLIVRDNI
jgi:hypothetical protein